MKLKAWRESTPLQLTPTQAEILLQRNIDPRDVGDGIQLPGSGFVHLIVKALDQDLALGSPHGREQGREQGHRIGCPVAIVAAVERARGAIDRQSEAVGSPNAISQLGTP